MTTETCLLEMVFPDQTNHSTLFEGHALRLMDMAAFVLVAVDKSRKPVPVPPANLSMGEPS